MAITYNGTPVTSVRFNGVNYTTIADENGYLYYACNPIYYYGNDAICYRFVGFDYDNGNAGGNLYARAIIEYCACTCGNGYLRWVGGPRSCNSNLAYNARMEFQLGCIHQQIIGCGYCGVNYTFDITQNPLWAPLYKKECNVWLETCPGISSADACADIMGLVWTCDGNNCRLYSPWVVVHMCDYNRLCCQNLINICCPVLLPYRTTLCANLKSETGCTEFCCKYQLQPIGGRDSAITCSIQVC